MKTKTFKPSHIFFSSLIIFTLINSVAHAQDWNTSGNSGLGGSNFIGTTDGINLNLLTNTSAGGTTAGDIVFKPSSSERARFKANGQLRIGNNSTNNALFSTDGDLTFNGSADYTIDDNRYVFRGLNDQDPGLNFNTSNTLFEFKNASASTFASLNYSTGEANFKHPVIIDDLTASTSPYTTKLFVHNHAVDAFSRAYGVAFSTSNVTADDVRAFTNAAGPEGETYALSLVGFRNDIQNASSNSSSITYGIQAVTYGTTGTVYGIYSSVTGGITKYAGYFTGGQSYFSTNVGIGTSSPSALLQLSSDNAVKPSTSTWTIGSDQRLKKDVHSFTDGWNVLKYINPVWFTYNGEAETPLGETSMGTIAQDLQKVAPYMVSSWKYSDDKGKATEYLAANYHALFFILTNTVKEQHVKIDSISELNTKLQAQINILQTDNAQIKSQIADILKQLSYMNSNHQITSNGQVDATLADGSVPPSLSQNAPNPFSQNTVIHYFLPKNITSAQIIVTTLTGNVLKSVDIAQRGAGQIQIDAGTLVPGSYHYSLIVNGKIVDTKKMEIIK